MERVTHMLELLHRDFAVTCDKVEEGSLSTALFTTLTNYSKGGIHSQLPALETNLVF